jgi:UDP-galactopyranose mutase
MSRTHWPIVVYSHLRWNFVYQRPQHVLSRMARRRRIFFVEEPAPAEGKPRIEVSFPVPNVLRCLPTGMVTGEPFHPAHIETIAPLLAQLLDGADQRAHVAWLYTPLAIDLARRLTPSAIVYDCMDELSAFAGASPALVAREAELFEVADVVFTGGPSLYRAKRDRHPNVHCFPSSVDVAHFETARARDARPGPRLGFYGVLDERLDRDLLREVAARRPDWQIEIVGPVVKIDPASLPRAANLHYPGAREYRDLPAVIAGWDVCLMPFALNEATRFISPTKVLEYMAAERPIVSTPITDVAEPYGDVVRIARTADEFVAACEAALSEPPAEAARRTERMRAIVAATSWHNTVAAMAAQIDDVTHRKGEAPWQDTTRSSSAPAPLA